MSTLRVEHPGWSRELFAPTTVNGMPVRYRVAKGGRGSSKCFAPDTPVLMYNGSIKPVGDVVVGELVMGPDSKPRKVLHTTTGTSEMYRVMQTSAMNYVVNADHILSLKKSNSCAGDKGPINPNTGKPKRARGRYPDEPEIKNLTVSEYLKKSNRWRESFRGYRAGVIDYPNNGPLPVDPYFLGVWLGDGTSREPTVTTADSEIIDYLFEFADRFPEISAKKQQNRGKAVVVALSTNKPGQRNPLWKALIDIGVAKPRSEYKRGGFKHIPIIYQTASVSDRLQLLADLLNVPSESSSP
ncbi:MAG: Hint domain-containing homing endonuclease, partial [Pseudomonadota bacterium]